MPIKYKKAGKAQIKRDYLLVIPFISSEITQVLLSN